MNFLFLFVVQLLFCLVFAKWFLRFFNQENTKAIEQKESNYFMDNDDGIYF